MAKVGGQKLPKRGTDKEGTKSVKTPADGKGGARIKTGGMGHSCPSGKCPAC